MNIVDQSGQSRGAVVVVVNELGQHALWPAARRRPAGWRRQSAAMPRREAVAAVDAAWADLAPASAPAGPGGGLGGDGRFVHEAFAEQAARHPEATALAAGRARVTYRELDQSSSRLAHYLVRAGVGPETVAGIHLERGVSLIRAMLAVMKAGGGYLPLDPSLPAERLARVCAQVRPVAVLTATAGPFPAAGARLVPLAEAEAAAGGLPATAPGHRPHPDNLCYVIYTSGSTGDPKAVAVSYRSLAGVIERLTAEYGLGRDDRVAQFAAMAFDTSLEQVFTALTAGATLTLPPPGTMAPSELLRGIERKRITALDLTPAYWHQVLALTEPADARLRTLRLMITGGEMADPADCRAALRAAPWARLLNAYGLTETTITSAVFDVGPWLASTGLASTGLADAGWADTGWADTGWADTGPADAGRAAADDPLAAVPVGRPAGGARLMVLDDDLNPVPAGAEGEIYIGGDVVARGYLGRPGLTAERFLPDPQGPAGGRMYRTGDLGQLRPDGRLEVAGRADRQLKVRGFRVEPGEIENVLAGHPDIAEVSVAASPRSSGDTRLVAYYTPAPAGAGAAPRHPSAASLRHYLADRLPGYMIPAAFVPRHRLPAEGGHAAGPHPGDTVPEAGQRPGDQVPDGQVPDGQRPDDQRPDDQVPDEWHTPVETGLSALWARLLKRDQVHLDDDFFALGGNSLLAAEMLAHTRALLGIPADAVGPLTRRLLRDPTLRGFAGAAAQASAGQLSADGDQADIDFTAEAGLKVSVRADGEPRPGWRRPGQVLLTGATGFLGAHLLRELVEATGATVHCLVRADDQAAARARLAEAARRYQLPAPPPDRVVPLPGDLAEERLGLPAAAFRRLAAETDVIYHAGALVNFIYPYQDLRAANVGGTREIIRLAGLSRGIPVHYVSTTAVLASLGLSGTREATEETALTHPGVLRMGYVETKYVAEELLRNAARAGLPVAVYRPLDIVGSERTGAWHTATEMCALIRFIADTGLAPAIDLPLDFVAADTCAAAIRHISATEEAAGRTYHLASPASAPLGTLVGRLRERGYRVDEIPYSDWVRELARRAARDPSHPMAAFLPLFVNRGAGGLTVAEMYLKEVFPAYTRTNTERALRGSGIAFVPVSGALMDRNIDRLMSTGYLPAPSGRKRPAHVG